MSHFWPNNPKQGDPTFAKNQRIVSCFIIKRAMNLGIRIIFCLISFFFNACMTLCVRNNSFCKSYTKWWPSLNEFHYGGEWRYIERQCGTKTTNVFPRRYHIETCIVYENIVVEEIDQWVQLGNAHEGITIRMSPYQHKTRRYRCTGLRGTCCWNQKTARMDND